MRSRDSAPRPEGPAPAVELSGVVRKFGTVTAVDGLDLTMDPGTVLALLGPNGAGKTTTVEMCEGFAGPDAGTVRVLGLDPVRDAARLKPRIGVMLQGGGAYPGARAGEMLHLVASYSAHPLDPRWLVSVLGLENSLRTPYRRLSGGQQQRLALACAIVGRPELVFLDEPTAGLDAQARNVVWELVDALRRDGVSILLTTHLMDEAEQLADRVVIVDHGRAVASGSPTELTTGAGRRRITFTAPPRLDVAAIGACLPGDARVAEPAPGRYTVSGEATPRVVAALTGWCVDNDVLLAGLSTAKRSLEDVFLELTGRELRA
ncbi:ABC transporter ATP-binding protein [Tomitella cavernea]|uniref:ABC transporter ATP-binding protein n=1 Tax=Tomitella cavernea TaxID=1387982 RepID=UPI00355678A9